MRIASKIGDILRFLAEGSNPSPAASSVARSVSGTDLAISYFKDSIS